MATALPLGPVEVHTQIGFEGDPNPQQDHGAHLCAVSPDFFRALGIPLLAGRAFNDADTAGAPEVAIVNDVVARRYWPNDTPIGKHVNMSGCPPDPGTKWSAWSPRFTIASFPTGFSPSSTGLISSISAPRSDR